MRLGAVAVPGHPGKAHGRTRAVGIGLICSPEGVGTVALDLHAAQVACTAQGGGITGSWMRLSATLIACCSGVILLRP